MLADAKSVQEHGEYAFNDSKGSCEVAGEIRLLKNLGQVKFMGIDRLGHSVKVVVRSVRRYKVNEIKIYC